MKKIPCIIVCFTSFYCFAQHEKWSVSISSGIGFGGPSASIKNQMVTQGFNQPASYNFFGLSGTTNHPNIYTDPSLLLRFSKRKNRLRSLYFIVGQSEKGQVTGFKNQGYSSFFGLIGGSDGPKPTINYKVFQLTGGYMYHTGSGVKLGVGPSLFFVPYSANKAEKHTSVIPGVLLTARVPLGKEKKLFGVDLLFDATLAPPVKMSIDEKSSQGFHMKNANMMKVSAGLAFTFRSLK